VTGSCTVALDEADLYAAFRLLGQRNRTQARPVLLLAVLLAAVIVALLVLFPEARFAFAHSALLAGLLGVVIFLALVVVLVLAATPALLRRAARRTLIEHPGMADPITYAIGPDTFTIHTVFSQATYPWGGLHGWREDTRIILVLLTRQLFYVVPKRQAEPALLELLRERLQDTGRASPETLP
jgi:cation transport ATPase